MAQPQAQIEALEKLWRFATREPVACFGMADEGTLSFTQTEAQAIWNRIREDSVESLKQKDELGVRVVALNEIRDALHKLEHGPC